MDFNQDERFLRVEGPFDKAKVALRQLRCEEQVSGLFKLELQVITALDAPLDPKEVLGAEVTASIFTEEVGARRYFNGIVSRMGRDPHNIRDFGSYRLEVVPKLWLLTRNTNCRIFQEKKVTEVLEEVLNPYKMTFTMKPPKHNPTLEYCVQYRETDFDFFSRLAEEYGIFYFFKHSDKKHDLTLSGEGSSFEDCVEKTVVFSPNRPFGPVIRSWSSDFIFRTGQWVQRDYNFETPDENLETKKKTKLKPQSFKKHEFYDYPGSYMTPADGDKSTELRMEQEESGYSDFSGGGHCASFSAGHIFEFEDDPFIGSKQSYILTMVRHSAEDPTHISGEKGQASYSNSFICITDDDTSPYRPLRRVKKPTSIGPQTAFVVANNENEVDCDEYGRIKVCFHWDRDDTSSCWVRVAQDWAGKKFGTFFWPRGGMEVVVDFLEGDMDRPLVTGCVYNKKYMPPYALPGDKTRSGIKTRSSPGGGDADFNELRFEDKAGSEEIYLHAQKDFNRVVENDDSLEVQNDQTITIGSEQTISVTGDRTLTVKQGNQTTDISAGKVTMTAAQSIELKVGGSSIKLEPASITIKSVQIKIQGNAQVEVTAPITKVIGSGMLVLNGGMVMIN